MEQADHQFDEMEQRSGQDAKRVKSVFERSDARTSICLQMAKASHSLAELAWEGWGALPPRGDHFYNHPCQKPGQIIAPERPIVAPDCCALSPVHH